MSMSFISAGMTGSDVSVAGVTGSLHGYLLSPKRPETNLVLIVPGSGYVDRDGNSPSGVHASSYRLLAEELGKLGVPTLRIDKRGMFSSADALKDPNDVTIEDYASDVRSWISHYAKDGRCMWLLGHSEGALVAEVAAQNTTHVCGLILVSPAGRRLGDVLLGQIRAQSNDPALLSEAQQAIRQLESGEKVSVSSLSPPLKALFRPRVQNFLIDDFSFDPASILKKIKLPTLILQGNNDMQVGVGDMQRLKEYDPSAIAITLPGMTHMLKDAPLNDVSANRATYTNPDLPLDPLVAPSIRKFISAHEAKPR